jgi:hypothetical protein
MCYAIVTTTKPTTMGNILGTILKTINDVQAQNRANPNEPTADKNIFDFLKSKINDIDQKSKAKRVSKGKSPDGILDLIRKEIEGAKKQNQQDPNVETAPSSIFDKIMKKVEEPKKRQASSGLRKIVEDYNLDVSKLPRDIVAQVQQKYMEDRKIFDKKYAQALFDLSKKY